MENILKYLYYSLGIVIGIALIIGTLVLLYYLFKIVYFDLKGAQDYKDYYCNYYKAEFDSEAKKNKEWYERQLSYKSKEYFKEFYDEAMKKKEEQNESA